MKNKLSLALIEEALSELYVEDGTYHTYVYTQMRPDALAAIFANCESKEEVKALAEHAERTSSLTI